MSILKCARWQEAQNAAVETRNLEASWKTLLSSKHKINEYVARGLGQITATAFMWKKKQQEKQGKVHRKGERISETSSSTFSCRQCVKRAGEAPSKRGGSPAKHPGFNRWLDCRIGLEASEIEQSAEHAAGNEVQPCPCGAPVRRRPRTQRANEEVVEKVQRAVQSTHGTDAKKGCRAASCTKSSPFPSIMDCGVLRVREEKSWKLERECC